MKFKMNNDTWEIKEISNAEMNIINPSNKNETFTYGITQYSEFVIYLNEESKGKSKRRTLIHELMHCFLFEYGHNQESKEFTCEDICEIVGCSHDIIHKIVEDYFKEKDLPESESDAIDFLFDEETNNNKKVTIYELLTMIKNKQAPKYVDFFGLIYEFSSDYEDYINIDEETKIKAYLSSAIGHIELFNYFDKKYIEIVDEV